MHAMKWLFALTLLITAFSTAWAADDDAVKKELKQLQGNWQMASHKVDGKPDSALKGAMRVVEGDKFTIKVGDKVVRAGTMKLDPSKNPKWIDITYTDGPEKGKTRLGIYALDGDTHKICYGDLGKDRPTEFVSKPGTGHRLVVFKRIETTIGGDAQADPHGTEIGEILFENDYAKVLKVRLEPGQRQPSHHGGYRLIYSLNDYVITWNEHRQPQGKRHWKQGQLHFHRPGVHSAENSGPEAAEWLVLALKAPPSAGQRDNENGLLEVAPKHARELFDNEFFKVHHVKLGPGDSIPRHTGGPRLIYSLCDYTVRYTDSGEPREETFKQGDFHWHEAGPHELESVGSGPVEFLIFHYKPSN